MEQNKKTPGKRKINRKLYRAMAALFAGIILLLMVTSILIPDRKFSDEENRVLAEMPKANAETVANKDYMTDLESYYSDQFLFRDLWIRFKVQCDIFSGKREFNGVYLGKDKYLMQIPADPDEENLQNNFDAMNEFAENHSGLTMNAMIVPDAVSIMEDYLPKGAPVRDQDEDMSNIKKQLGENMGIIDVTSEMKKHADEGLYYKTDHHWTSKGASIGFSAAVSQLGIENPVSDYEVYTVSADFSGTLASKSGYHKAKDTVEIYVPKDMEIQYLVNDSDNQERRPTVYSREALKEKDKYQVFFGGNHATVDIKTTNATAKRLLIFKDSYANCFVPFLLPYYNEIVMIDPRYYYDDVQSLINTKGITDVLFLYNMDTFLNDNSIADVLAEE